MVSNMASMILYIGNPTNVIVAQAYNLSFIEYSRWMCLPSAASMFVAFCLNLIVFWKSIPEKLVKTRNISAFYKNFAATFRCLVLIGCLITLMIVPLYVRVCPTPCFCI